MKIVPILSVSALVFSSAAFAAPIVQVNCDGHAVQVAGSAVVSFDGHVLRPARLPFGVITGGRNISRGERAYADGAGSYYRTSFLLGSRGDRVMTVLVLNSAYGVPMATFVCR